MVSPIFLLVKIGRYPSPASFQALVMLGLFLILFEHRTDKILPLLSTGELLIAIGVRSWALNGAIKEMSYLFVDVTSYLVKAGIRLFGIPITMNKNIAAVRDSIVIIGSGCSGLDAFVIYILATLLLIYIRRSSREEAALLLLGALGIIPLNALRIFTLLIIGYHSGISFLELFHSHLGDLMFLAYVFLYWRWVMGRKRENISGA
jgi:exosortase/archaeosortase family protein